MRKISYWPKCCMFAFFIYSRLFNSLRMAKFELGVLFRAELREVGREGGKEAKLGRKTGR